MKKRLLIAVILIGFIFSSSWIIFAEKSSTHSVGGPVNSNSGIVEVYGVVDRVEDNDQVVILIDELQLELVVSKDDFDVAFIPSLWVELTLKDGEIKAIVEDWGKTDKEAQKVKKLMESLFRKSE